LKQSWVQNTDILVVLRPNEPFDDDDNPDYVYTDDADENDCEDDHLDYFSMEDHTVATSNISNSDDVITIDTDVTVPTTPTVTLPDSQFNEYPPLRPISILFSMTLSTFH
jgi:hypothetical protein